MRKKHIILYLLLLNTLAIYSQDYVYLDSGNNLYNNQKYTEAEGYYYKAIQSDSNNFMAWFNLYNVFFQEAKWDILPEKLDSLKNVTSNKIWQEYCLYNKGNAFLEQQKFSEAIEAYKEALRINPYDKDAQQNLRYAMLKKRQEEEKQKEKQKQNQEQNQSKDNQENQEEDQQQSELDKRKELIEQLLKYAEQDEQKALEKVRKLQQKNNKNNQSNNNKKDW